MLGLSTESHMAEILLSSLINLFLYIFKICDALESMILKYGIWQCQPVYLDLQNIYYKFWNEKNETLNICTWLFVGKIQLYWWEGHEN